jgi:HPt (histidine-containing phosphotransfer) domain-containing protein
MATAPTIDPQVLDSYTRGDKQLQKMLVETMLADAPVAMDEIRGLLEKQDWDKLFRAVHKLKPNVEMMGMLEVIRILKPLNSDLRQQRNLATVPRRTENLLDALGRALDALRRQYPT